MRQRTRSGLAHSEALSTTSISDVVLVCDCCECNCELKQERLHVSRQYSWHWLLRDCPLLLDYLFRRILHGSFGRVSATRARPREDCDCGPYMPSWVQGFTFSQRACGESSSIFFGVYLVQLHSSACHGTAKVQQGCSRESKTRAWSETPPQPPFTDPSSGCL